MGNGLLFLRRPLYGLAMQERRGTTLRVPTDLKTEERKVWRQLFANLKPETSAQVEMSKRYVEWLLLYRKEQEHCRQNGTTIFDKNGCEKSSPHMTNMGNAEGHMRQLWRELQKLIAEPAKGDGVGEKYFG